MGTLIHLLHGMHYWNVGYRLEFCELNYFLSAQRAVESVVNSLITYNSSSTPFSSSTSSKPFQQVLSLRKWQPHSHDLPWRNLVFGASIGHTGSGIHRLGAFRDKLVGERAQTYKRKAFMTGSRKPSLSSSQPLWLTENFNAVIFHVHLLFVYRVCLTLPKSFEHSKTYVKKIEIKSQRLKWNNNFKFYY